MGEGLRRRLERLEEHHTPAPEGFPDWPLTEQAENVLEALRIHRIAGTVQLATDREIHVMGLVCAAHSLGEAGGEHVFPSGLAVTLTPDEDSDGGFRVEAPRRIFVEDLPEGVREYFERIDPAEQPARDRWLYERWPATKEEREYWRHYFSEEQVRARREESERRDRELMERNRGGGGRSY